jgi:general L-amino acid transport system ATP-binding protein
MLRCINRLEDWQRGRVIVDGKELTDDAKQILAVRRDVGMVFQQFNLFPHLTVLENCTLAPIWVRRMPKKDAEELAMRYLRRVRIPDQALKYPSQLSGGQQLAGSGITMLVVTHEMGFARQVANRIIFMADGQIVEINEPKAFFEHPQHERTQLFLRQILH